MTSVASRPSYQSIQCAPAGWALRQPDRLYHVLCIRTSREVRQTSSSQAGISTHSASSLHSHAVGTFVVPPSIPSSMLLLLLLVGGGSMTVEKRDVPLGVAANRWWGMEKQDVQVGAIKTARPIRAWWSIMLMRQCLLSVLHSSNEIIMFHARARLHRPIPKPQKQMEANSWKRRQIIIGVRTSPSLEVLLLAVNGSGITQDGWKEQRADAADAHEATTLATSLRCTDNSTYDQIMHRLMLGGRSRKVGVFTLGTCLPAISHHISSRHKYIPAPFLPAIPLACYLALSLLSPPNDHTPI